MLQKANYATQGMMIAVVQLVTQLFLTAVGLSAANGVKYFLYVRHLPEC